MIAYIIKFVLCSGFLYSFYKAFLERESMYKINRFYLLFSLVFALFAPLYKMHLPITEQETPISSELISYLMANPDILQEESAITWTNALNWLYTVIGIGLALRFIFNIGLLIYCIKQEDKYDMDELTIVLDKNSKQPFSFLHYIFLPKDDYQTIHPNLVQHEKAHCIQKHSWDILFIEIYQIIFWFNPFVYLYKKSVQLNHEFLADEYVLQNNVDLKFYQLQILDSIAAQSQNQMVSHFNFILTKKRLLMMTKNTSKRKMRILSFASFPFILSAFVLFSQKSFAQGVNESAKKVENALDQKVENPIKDVMTSTIDSLVGDTIKTKKFKISNKHFTLTDQDLGDINTKDIKNIDIKDHNNAIITLKSGETKEIKLNELPQKSKFKINDKGEMIGEGKFSISNTDQLNSIDPKEIKSIVVGKDRNSLQVIKKNNDTIRFSVDSKFKASNSTILKLDDLSTNEILTPAIKAKLKDIDIKNFAGIEMLKRNGTKVIQVEDKILVFDAKDKLISESKIPSKLETNVFGNNIVYNSKTNSVHTFSKELTKEQQKAIVEAHEKMSNTKNQNNNKSDWSIDVQPQSNQNAWSITTKVVSIDDVIKSLDDKNTDVWSINYNGEKPETKKQIEDRLKLEKLNKKLAEKRIKELEKQQKQLK